jgi:excinuclease UvrABC nuclease subunit
MNATWRPHLHDIPERPGVYLFHDARGAILYIGKALNLRRRVASYFHQRRAHPRRLRRMIRRARAVTTHETGSELEALLLESRLLKQETPPFNRLSTTYVALPFVKLTLAEPFPRLLITREFASDGGGQYLGPFPHFKGAAVVVAALQRLFALRTCEDAVLPGVTPQPCEAFQLRKCAAPCVGPQQASIYHRQVDRLLALLVRGPETVLQRLREERQRAAEAMFFERARHLHTLQAALNEALMGRPLALLPVAWRNILAIFDQKPPHAREIFCIRRGLFAGRIVLDEGPQAWHKLAACLTINPSAGGPELRSTDAVVDELRLVAGWLQRTRARARWIHFNPQMSPTAMVEALREATSSDPGHEPWGLKVALTIMRT